MNKKNNIDMELLNEETISDDDSDINIFINKEYLKNLSNLNKKKLQEKHFLYIDKLENISPNFKDLSFLNIDENFLTERNLDIDTGFDNVLDDALFLK